MKISEDSWFLIWGRQWRPTLFSFFLLTGCLAGRNQGPEISIWATGDSLKIRPDTAYQSKNYHWDANSSTLSLSGAANEWVAAQLVLSSPHDLPGLRLQAGGLRGLKGEIKEKNISFFQEHYVEVKQATDRNGSTGAGWYPDPLIPFYNPYSDKKEELALPLTIPGDSNLPIWMDLFIPPGTPDGVYRGEITLRRGKAPIKKIKLKLTVFPFSLPARKELLVFFDLYGGRWSRGEGIPFALNDRSWQVLKEYEIMAHRHGFSNGHWGLMPSGIAATGGMDWSSYDRYLGQVLDGSLFRDRTPPSCWELPFPENWDPGERVLRRYCRELVGHWEEKGWDLKTAFAYVWDEKGPLNKKVKAYGEILREAGGGKINYFYTSGPHPNLFGIVDWWSPRASQYQPDRVKERQKEGEKGFFYHAGEPSAGLMCLDAVGPAFRSWGWLAWKYRADGFFDWASNFWGETPYTNPRSYGDDNGNLYLFYPGRGLSQIGLPPIAGPVSSFRMKMVRRGIQDYEYFHLARGLGLDPDPAVNSIVRRGLGETGSYGIDPRAWSRDPEEWYRARDEIARMIGDKTNKN